MKTLTGILFLVLHMSCSLLIPQLSSATVQCGSTTEISATHCPSNEHNIPLDQYPGEDQETESSVGLEESGNYIYFTQSVCILQPLYLETHDIRYYRDSQRFLSETGEVLAPPPKA